MTDFAEFPGSQRFGDGQSNGYVTQLGTWLIARGGERFYSVGPGPSFGTADRDACAAFQRAQGWSGDAADGIPGPATWNLLRTGGGHDIASGDWLAPIQLSDISFDPVTDGSTSAAVRSICDRLGIPSVHWVAGVAVAAQRESSFRWNAVNDSDSNAHGPKQSDGFPLHCSRGVLQCIPTTFATFHMTGTSHHIYDGEASIGAAMNYVISRYDVSNDGSDLPAKVQQFDDSRDPHGY
jgi:Transglycosylase SLT domain